MAIIKLHARNINLKCKLAIFAMAEYALAELIPSKRLRDNIMINIHLRHHSNEGEAKLDRETNRYRPRSFKVILDNKDIEVLATSVLDKTILSTQEFKKLYFNRWKIESYYDIMKNRLSLENFSGTTVLSIKQDFYATMFISNLESALSHGLNEELENEKGNKRRKYTQKVNKSVSFNAIKNYTFDLFLLPNKDKVKTLDKIYKQLRTNLVAIRANRHYKRPDSKESKNTKAIKSANFYKRKKKSGF